MNVFNTLRSGMSLAILLFFMIAADLNVCAKGKFGFLRKKPNCATPFITFTFSWVV
jgi:hypothetical protein